jgi:hypothetical protein
VTTNLATNFVDTTTNQVVLIQQNGTGYGLKVTAASNYAIFGSVTGTIVGTTYGVRGHVNATTGAGILGDNAATTGVAYGLYGQTSSVSGFGLFGRAVSGTGTTIGLAGHADSTGGTGISGIATASSGATVGITAEVRSAGGTALVLNNTLGGKLLSARNNGVEKLSVDGSGDVNTSGSVGVVASTIGVTALNVQATELTTANTAIQAVSDGTNGTGVIGEAENGSLAFGVMGISSSGFAGDFSGNVNVTGTLSAASKNFKIDDPIDPANKFLFHASVESSEMKTIYDGAVTLGANGEAMVQLPEWFQALNQDFRYQLTCVGGYAPVYIAAKIENNQFKIAGGSPGLEVDWQVTGVRHDPYAVAHPLQVETEKPANERGYLLHPELYGQPPQKSIEWAEHPQLMRNLTKAKASRKAASHAEHRGWSD